MRRRATPSILAFALPFALLGAAALPAAAQTYRDTDASLQTQLETWFRQANARAPGVWGIAVADNQGRLMWGIQPTRPLIPASTVKLLTTGYARSVVGADARKTTRVMGSGQLDAAGTWRGSWSLELNGDPTLEHRGAGTTSLTDLATQLATRGVRRLSGPLIVTSAEGAPEARFPSTWSVRHEGRVFAPPVGNLTIHDNLVSASVSPGTKTGQRARLVGASPSGADLLFRVTAKTVAGKRSRLRVEPQADGTYIVAGSIGLRSRARGLVRAATDTRKVLAAMWQSALDRAGIEWNQTPALVAAKTGPTVLAEIQSPVFDSMASEINRRSINLGAELMLRWAAGSDPTPGDRLTAHVQQVTGDYAGVRLVDGSGLSDQDRVSPYTFVSYLARFPLAPGGKNFPMLLPPNGSGTLWRLASGMPQRGILRAKTGTLGNVATLVGYLGRADGVLLISLMYNGSRVYAARQQQWKLLRLLGAEGVVIPSDSTDVVDHLGGEARE